MSVNIVNESTGELVTLSSGVRCWIGTKAAHTIAVANHTIPNNVMVCITDDYDDQVANVVEEGNMKPVTSNAVYNAIQPAEHFISGYMEDPDNPKFKLRISYYACIRFTLTLYTPDSLGIYNVYYIPYMNILKIEHVMKDDQLPSIAIESLGSDVFEFTVTISGKQITSCYYAL